MAAPPAGPSRRRFLAIGGLGALALVCGGVGLGLQATALREPRAPLTALDPVSFSILAAVADALCPGAPGLPDAWELQVPEAVDAFLASSDPAVAVELSQALRFVENGLPGLLLDGRPRPFSTRSKEERLRTLERMATSRIHLRRTIYKALMGLVTATYWGDPRTFAHSGYRVPDYRGMVPAVAP